MLLPVDGRSWRFTRLMLRPGGARCLEMETFQPATQHPVAMAAYPRPKEAPAHRVFLLTGGGGIDGYKGVPTGMERGYRAWALGAGLPIQSDCLCPS